MSEPFHINIDNIKEGVVQKIDVILSSKFIDVNEEDLIFNDVVKVSGDAYLADEDLVLHISASTIAQMPCSICNNLVPFTLSIKGYYHAEPLNAIKGSFFDFRPLLRESLLIELPKVIECNENCPQRATLAPYLRKSASPDESEHYFPFNDLKLP